MITGIAHLLGVAPHVETILLVLLGVIVIGYVLRAVMSLLVWWAKRVLHTRIQEIGQPVIVEPELGSVCGTSIGFIHLKCQGAIAVATGQLLFQKLTGTRLEIAFTDMAAVEKRTYPTKLGLKLPPSLSVTTHNGNEFQFEVNDIDRWVEQIREHISKSSDREDKTHG